MANRINTNSKILCLDSKNGKRIVRSGTLIRYLNTGSSVYCQGGGTGYSGGLRVEIVFTDGTRWINYPSALRKDTTKNRKLYTTKGVEIID